MSIQHTKYYKLSIQHTKYYKLYAVTDISIKLISILIIIFYIN